MNHVPQPRRRTRTSSKEPERQKPLQKMRTILIPLLVWALPCLAQPAATAPAATLDPMGCAFYPFLAQTHGEQIKVMWASPACRPAHIRVYRRNSTGEEHEIHPLMLVADRNDTTFAICWDTLFTELGIYEYRVVPVDSMGNEWPSSRWAVANNLHQEVAPWVYSINVKDVPDERSISIQWTLENPERARGIVIYRSERFDGPYERLAGVSPATDTYVDRVRRVKEVYFYRIEVIDVVGLSSVSMPVQGLSDTEPLAPPPLSLGAEPGPQGIQLHWHSVGPDASHYKVERGFPGEEKWVLVADGLNAPPEGPVQWTDSAAKDNRVRNYRVRTVSIGGRISEPSKTLTVQAADGTMPSTPTDVSVRTVEGAVVVSWRDPWAADLGLFQANVERADTGSTEFVVLNKKPLEGGITLYHDSTAIPGKPYTYRVVGLSLAGTQGVPSLSAVLKGVDPATTGPRMLLAHRQTNGIALQWPARERQGKGFHLYRSVDDGEPQLLKTLPIDASSYLDGSAVEGSMHLYTIALVLPDGTESDPSEPVAVRW